MIINVFSTPRTGSTWFAHAVTDRVIQQRGPLVSFLSEPFNPYHYNLYHEEIGESIFNHQEYKEGYYYKKLIFHEGKIVSEKIFAPKTQTMVEEFLEKADLISKATNDLVIHNHISPLPSKAFDFLVSLTDKNYMLCRRDLKQQLASYAIAYHTKQFVNYKSQAEADKFANSVINSQVMENLVKRILDQKKMIEDHPSLFKVYYYEDIPFQDFKNYPRKQNVDAWGRLVDEDQDCIMQLLKTYGLS